MKSIILFSFILLTFVSCSSTKEENTKDQQNNNLNTAEVVAPSYYQDKFIRGMDFFARGNEPNWILEMDFQSNFSFKPMYDSSLNVPAVEGVNEENTNITTFQSQNEKGKLLITITKTPCEDNMSGERFDYKVKVEVINSNNTNNQIYEGCGRYLYDYRLNDIWEMESFSGIDLKKEELMKGLPTFELNLKDMRFSGHAGCNNLSSKIDLKGNKIKFGNIAATMMACPDMKVERKVIDAINMKSFDYNIKNMKLTLENNSVKMIFKKVD